MTNVAHLINEAVGFARDRQSWYLNMWNRLAANVADGDEAVELEVRRIGEMDVLLRELGSRLAEMWRREDPEEFARYVPASSTAYSLSIAWIFAAYEMTRA